MIKRIFAIIMFLFTLNMVNASENIRYNSNLPHWDKTTISVYIPKDSNSSTIKNAFESWKNDRYASSSLKFEYLDDSSKADIVVKYVTKLSQNSTPLADYQVTKNNNIISNAQLIVLNDKNVQKKYSDKMYIAMLEHQIGHILGYPTNPRACKSVMHLPLTEDSRVRKIDQLRLYRINNWKYSNHYEIPEGEE